MRGVLGFGRNFGLFADTDVVDEGSIVPVHGVELIELDGQEVYGGPSPLVHRPKQDGWRGED